jgi:hypothetical protein
VQAASERGWVLRGAAAGRGGTIGKKIGKSTIGKRTIAKTTIGKQRPETRQAAVLSGVRGEHLAACMEPGRSGSWGGKDPRGTAAAAPPPRRPPSQSTLPPAAIPAEPGRERARSAREAC